MNMQPGKDPPSGGSQPTLRQRLDKAQVRQGSPRSSRANLWGLTPSVTVVLLVIAGIAVAAGVNLALTAPRSPYDSAAAPSETAVVPTLVPAARPPAEEAIEDYVVLLRQGMYDVAWGRTTPRFQAENYPSGLTAYQQAWAGIAELEVVSKKVILQTDDTANVVAEIHDLGSDTTYTNAYTLVFDGASGLWKIDAVNQIW